MPKISPDGIQSSTLKRIACGVALAGAVMFVGAGSAQAVEPTNSSESAALNARLLQTEMMVAALTCDMRTEYNTVVVTFKQELVRHGKVLRQMFRRNHGAAAQRRLDRYITQLANDASARSIADRSTYCRTARVLFDDVLTTRNGAFDQMTAQLVQKAALPIGGR